MGTRARILQLHKEILREAQNFKSYYYRNYFTRKTKTSFKKYSENSENESEQVVQSLESTLAMLRRQTQIANMYVETRLVLEDKDKGSL